MTVPYKHEPFTDFAIKENHQALQEALAYVNTQLNKEYPLIVGEERITTAENNIG
jgi:1-pyrroline-5-carboxylate dehydrogenase